jgi:polar amino acid transport system permease protein
MTGVAPTAPNPLPSGRRWRLPDRGRPSSPWIALVSTIVVFGVVGYLILNSPGWPEVQRLFFSADRFASSLPHIVGALGTNVRLFLLAEVGILLFALLLAVMRSLPGPVFFPFRLMSIAYTDLFRALPSIVVIYLLGLGIPALQLPGLPPDAFFWGLVSLVLVWSAYVAEVYRAGIESVHPSQEAAARSLGLSRAQGLRYVVLPQAIRRVIPPLLNDFIGLQKDTVLVSFIGVIEIFRRAQIDASGAFNFTAYVACAVVFLVLTIPMTRLVDLLVARDRRRQLAGVAR